MRCFNMKCLLLLTFAGIALAKSDNGVDEDEDADSWLPPNATIADQIDEINKEDGAKGLIDGDIMPLSQEAGNGNEKRNAIRDRRRIWRTRIIPYVLHPSLTYSARRNIRAAIYLFEKKTCIRFKKAGRSRREHYILFLRNNGCYSRIGFYNRGRNKKFQIISIGRGCTRTGIIMHEIMHALGFDHEQNRYDRDKYIKINWSNIRDGKEHNFKKQTIQTITSLGLPYDYDGIMHYGAFGFAKNKKIPVIEKLKKTGGRIGNRKGFSDTDLKQLNLLYDCKTSSRRNSWSRWSAYSKCIDLNDGQGKREHSQRFCFRKNLKLCRGADWYGTQKRSRPCRSGPTTGPSKAVNGGWSNYGPYGLCSKTCGGGYKYRNRTCTNPAPANGGQNCLGTGRTKMNCNTEPCQDFGSVVSSRKSASQSSTGYGGVPSRAVDGNKNSGYGGRSCTSTNKQRNAWWRVDLGGNYLVTKVQVTNRGDCCWNRLSNFDIRVGNTDRNPKANQVCKQFYGAAGKGATLNLMCARRVTGRYVYVMLRGTNYLTLCEVVVFGKKLDFGSVVSSRKSASQSSTGYGGVPSRAVDGNKNSGYGGRSCTSTNKQRNAWWRVDLGGNYLVTKVQVTNRGDCCWNRLSNFDIRVGNTDRNPKANQLCKQFNGAAGKGETLNLMCTRRVTGRYVYVMLRGTNFLTLCEVVVFENMLDFGSSVSLRKRASQSSTSHGGLASRAVDGYRDSGYGGRSCTHTRKERNAWWRVDLFGIYLVKKVEVTNRGDCCWKRLSNFDIRVGRTDRNPKANQVCKQFNGAAGKGETLKLVCEGRITGRYVYVMLRGTNFLTLCEVVVYGSLWKKLG